MIAREEQANRDVSWCARVLGAIPRDPGWTVVAAPSGFGVGQLREALAAETVSGVARRLAQLTDDADEARIARLVATGNRVVSFGRFIPETSEIRLDVIDWRTLALTHDEVATLGMELGISARLTQAIHLFCMGWTKYFVACANEAALSGLTEPSDAVGRLRFGPHLTDLVTACTFGLDDQARESSGQIVQLGAVSASVLSSLAGPGALTALQRKGLPLVEVRSGWYEVLEPVATHLRAEAELDYPTGHALSAALTAALGPVEAAGRLIKAGIPQVAAELLRDIPVNSLDECNQDVLGPVLTTVLDTEKDDGTLGLRLARVFHNRGQIADQVKVLRTASRDARSQLRLSVAVEAETELLAVECRALDAKTIADRLSYLSIDAELHISNRALIRLRELRIVLSTESGELTDIYQSVQPFQAVAREWAVVGEAARATGTLRLLTSTSLAHLGKYADGIKEMEGAMSLVKDQPQALLRMLSLKTRMCALAAETDQFAQTVRETAELQSAVGLPWIEAFLAWSRMIMAGHERRGEEVAHFKRRARSLAGGLFEHPTGVTFAADASMAYLFAGKLEEARQELRLVESRVSEAPLEFGLAQFFVEARSEPHKAEALAADLRSDLQIPVEREWRIDLETALARRSAILGLEMIQKEAALYGLESLFESQRDSWAAPDSADRPSIYVLGGFRTTRNGQPIIIGSKKAVQLIKFLAVRGRAIPTEVLADHLWPETTTDLGIQRLKNVLKRARAALGADTIRRVGDAIQLNPEVQIDLRNVERLLADRTPGGRPVATSLIKAVDIANGALLALDVYDEWVEADRQALRTRLTAAIDHLVREHHVAPAWALRSAERVDISDDSLLLSIGQSAIVVADTETVQTIYDGLARRSVQLGVMPPKAIDDLQRYLDI